MKKSKAGAKKPKVAPVKPAKKVVARKASAKKKSNPKPVKVTVKKSNPGTPKRPNAAPPAWFKEGIAQMKDAQKKALIALAAAASALGAAAQALAESADDAPEEKKPEPKPEKKAPEKKPDPPKVEEKKEEPKKPPEKKEEPLKVDATKPDDLIDKCRAAAQEYAGVYGRDGLRAILDKFLPEGKKTLPDVPADKLSDLLKALS